MGIRGPKSTTELTTIGATGIAVQRRLDAPGDLTAEQADIWRSVVNANPADLFNPGSAALLGQLCRHTVAANRLGSWLQQVETADGPLDTELWFKLLARQEAESKVIAGLATRLRLTPQSRYTPRAAAVAGQRVRIGPAPWEAADA